MIDFGKHFYSCVYLNFFNFLNKIRRNDVENFLRNRIYKSLNNIIEINLNKFSINVKLIDYFVLEFEGLKQIIISIQFS
ncbi:hypothetical protein HERIO_499 [Hepatospora eriocheir]|uniref:Uncharacterized protein n=1 Tax=Hepatospora eriocheir TaxID=1081669 RepID=A0A1X0QD19_9MICR|nr:hypothetical protein HERIO_499 [Hepatospora eriocheir]